MAASKKYVVLADAVVVTVGQKKDGKPVYTRVLRGGVLNGSEGSEQIATLVRSGSIKHVSSREELAELQADLKRFPYSANDRTQNSRHRRTVRRAAQLMGAPDDPVQAPVQDIEPVPAPNPTIDPDAILAGADAE